MVDICLNNIRGELPPNSHLNPDIKKQGVQNREFLPP
jgi:hypothetical protein